MILWISGFNFFQWQYSISSNDNRNKRAIEMLKSAKNFIKRNKMSTGTSYWCKYILNIGWLTSWKKNYRISTVLSIFFDKLNSSHNSWYIFSREEPLIAPIFAGAALYFFEKGCVGRLAINHIGIIKSYERSMSLYVVDCNFCERDWHLYFPDEFYHLSVHLMIIYYLQ